VTPHDLLAAFETLADAPDGVKRLRELVLQMAVRGKLVPQDPTTESAMTLLSRIESERLGLIARERPTTTIPSKPKFALPLGWTWCTANRLIKFVTSGSRGWAEHYSDSGAIFLRIGNLDYGTRNIDLTKVQRVDPPQTAEAVRTRTQPGDVLISITGDTGMIGVVPEGLDAYINQHIALCRLVQPASAPYIAIVFISPYGLDQLQSRERGIKNSLGLDDIRAVLVPLPPLAEQHRIVARVDELMGLLDQLEAARSARDDVRRATRDAALVALRDADETTTVNIAWTFLANHIDQILFESEDIKSLRQTILHLAIQGYLVPRAEARTVRLGDVVEFLNGYAFKSEWYGDSGIKLVRNQNVGIGRLDWSDTKFIAKHEAGGFERFRLYDGDIVLSLDRPLISAGLKVAMVRECDLPCLLLQRVACPRPKDNRIDKRYLLLWFNSPAFTGAIDPGRSNGVPHISTRAVEEISLRLPSLLEQHRIVTQVDALMALCDELEARLTATRDLQGQAAAAAVHHLDV